MPRRARRVETEGSRERDGRHPSGSHGRARWTRGAPMPHPRLARAGGAATFELPHEITTFDLFVEQGKILEFARAIGEDDPVYRDAEVARSHGYDDIPAPLTFSVVS